MAIQGELMPGPSAQPVLSGFGWPRAARFDPFMASSLAIVAVTSILVLGLLAAVGWLSLTEGLPGDPGQGLTLENYRKVFVDSFVVTVLINTLEFCFATLIVALPFGLAAAWLAERTDFSGKTVLLTLMTIGLLIPGFASAMGWLVAAS